MEAEQLTLFAPDTLASLSPMPGSDLARTMTATSGRKCLDLCASSGPLGSLERMLLDTSRWASTAYLLTWKVKATAQGRSYFRLQPSEPRIEETGSSLWPTPTATCGDGRSEQDPEVWLVRYERTKREKGIRNGMPINVAVKLWPTPKASDGEKGGPNQRDSKGNYALPGAVHHAKLWPTPQASDNRDRGNLSNPAIKKRVESGKQVNLSMCVSEVSGQLNPAWVECLMGFPIGWTDVECEEPEESWIDNPRWPAGPGEEQYEWEPPRVAVGVKDRAARLKACGNAVVPAHAYPFMAAIKAVHEMEITR